MDGPVKPYKKDFDYSYTLGAFPTFELVEKRPWIVHAVYVHSGFTSRERLEELCTRQRIPVITDDRLLSKISPKENCYAAAVFEKYGETLRYDSDHVVLVHPGDMGNLGTIIRTLVGFGIQDLGIIAPGVDFFHPKVLRASMGALFRLRIETFPSFADYAGRYGNRDIFPFMTGGRSSLNVKDCPVSSRYTLVFGNEGAGLDPSYLAVGTSIRIPQSPEVDSLNLTIAVGIGAFVFSTANPRA